MHNVSKGCRRTRVRGSPWLLKSVPVSDTVEISDFHLETLFGSCDVNVDGRLSRAELKEALRTLGSRFPATRAARALHYADRWVYK
ncbi:Detected protein of unknown function [Hibiscus syriacus]|uniref:EF-hand domain-containing protein n=1 Tax=Hibiscus syriacus TaxID=106335 RepID=A0A6A2YH18_HIBSY|nr:Detected protein of unknown function [Hibiscus syriacus]